jgi:hypothetical protein
VWMPVLICVAMNGGQCTLYDNLGNISAYSLNLYSTRSACERAGASAVKKWSRDGSSYSYYCLDITSPTLPPQAPASRFQPSPAPGPATASTVPSPPARPALDDAAAAAAEPPAIPTRPLSPPRRTAPPSNTASAPPVAGARPPAAATPPSTIEAPAIVTPSPPDTQATVEAEAGSPPPSIVVKPEIAPPPTSPAPAQSLQPPKPPEPAPASTLSAGNDSAPTESTAEKSASVVATPTASDSAPRNGHVQPTIPVRQSPPSASVPGQVEPADAAATPPLPEHPASTPAAVVGDGPEHATAEGGHADAPHHLPWFITAPGSTDYLFNVMIAVVLAAIVAIGNLFFKLHALPERWAHGASPLQLEIVAVLSLIGLFTHQHVFWVGALLLAMVRFPDFWTPIRSMSDSVTALAQRMPRAMNGEGQVAPGTPVDPRPNRDGGSA